MRSDDEILDWALIAGLYHRSSASAVQRRRGPADGEKTVIAIIGRPGLQNNFLAGLLEKHLGRRCFIAPIDTIKSGQTRLPTIALLDAAAPSESGLESVLNDLHDKPLVQAVAVFNVDTETKAERLLGFSKMRGLFYRDTSEEQLCKGMSSILNGEHWLPRKMLSDYLETTRGTHRQRVPEIVDLTRKEKETLRVMVGGASNVDIANTLNVSPHTVKTHISNLFRKIKVSNRVQAVSWALENLVHEGQGRQS